MVELPDFKTIPITFVLKEISENKKRNICINYYLSTRIKQNPFDTGENLKSQLWELAKKEAPRLCMEAIPIYQRLLNIFF